jgi:hypothetical protein
MSEDIETYAGKKEVGRVYRQLNDEFMNVSVQKVFCRQELNTFLN